jgi:hypothetical protein
MDVTPFVPVIVEATKFVFDEVGKWIDDVRQRSKNASPELTDNVAVNEASKLTRQDFITLEANPKELETSINAKLAETDAYVIQGLINQIQTHRKSLIDLEAVETEYGILTPPYIKRSIEHEADAIVEKLARLKSLLEQVYGRRIENA